MLLYVSLLIRFVRKQYFVHAWIHALLLLVLLFICIGCNEITLLQLVLLHVVLAYKLKQKTSLYLLAITFIFALLVILSPGNEGRGANFVGRHQLIHSGLYATLQTFRFSLTWLSSLCLFLTSLLFIPFAVKNATAKSGFLNQLN
jgi:ABC-type molybdate transport system permease subunit